jgi:hypothetical protein
VRKEIHVGPGLRGFGCQNNNLPKIKTTVDKQAPPRQANAWHRNPPGNEWPAPDPRQLGIKTEKDKFAGCGEPGLACDA